MPTAKLQPNVKKTKRREIKIFKNEKKDSMNTIK